MDRRTDEIYSTELFQLPTGFQKALVRISDFVEFKKDLSFLIQVDFD